MSTFSYKSGGRTSRYLSDYRDQTVGSLNTSYTLEDWWETLDQTITVAETSIVSNNYGDISTYGSYGIACLVKGSGAANDNQVANGTILIVGARGSLKFSGSATSFPINVPYTSINCFGTGANRYCIYAYESGVVSDTVGLHGPSTIQVLGPRTLGSFISVRDHQKLFRFTNADESRTYVYNGSLVDEFLTEDYGLIIQQYTNQTCTNVQGVITSNTTAASGCIKVAPGTALTIAPTNTYTVPSQVAQPTTSLDYGNITDLDQVTRYDYVYIWRLRTERP